MRDRKIILGVFATGILLYTLIYYAASDKSIEIGAAKIGGFPSIIAIVLVFALHDFIKWRQERSENIMNRPGFEIVITEPKVAATATSPPLPPVIYEPTARLVYSDLGLPELFARTASNAGLVVELLHPEEVAGKVGEHLRSVGATIAIIPDSKMFRQIQLASQLIADGFDVIPISGTGWKPVSHVAVLVTDCFAAVAETGSIVFRRSLDFVLPPNSIVILEPKNFVPDLIDLFELIRQAREDVSILTGPIGTKLIVLN